METKRIILDIGDGPDGVKFYTDEQRSIVSEASPDSLWVDVSTAGASATFGPMLPGVAKKLGEAIVNVKPTCAETVGMMSIIKHMDARLTKLEQPAPAVEPTAKSNGYGIVCEVERITHQQFSGTQSLNLTTLIDAALSEQREADAKVVENSMDAVVGLESRRMLAAAIRGAK